MLLLGLAACEGGLIIEPLEGAPPPRGGPPRISYDGGGEVDAGTGFATDAGSTPQTDGGPGYDAGPPPPPPPPPSSMCPPTGGEGTNVGDVAPDMTFPLAAGGEVTVRSTCPNTTTMIYRFTESCGICRRWLERDANALYAELQGTGFEMIVLVGSARQSDGSYGTPTAADAARIRDFYSLTMPVAWEPNSEFLWTLHRSGAGVALLMTEGNVIAAPIGKVSNATVRSVHQGG